MVSALSLSNVVTVALALLCLGTIARQSGTVVKLWRLALPASFAVMQAFVLLASVFEATLETDAEWLAAAAVGSVLGRMRGWATAVDVDHTQDLVRQRRATDGVLAASALVLLALVDFVSAALQEALIEPQHVAAAAAFCAGYLACRALAIGVRTARLPHVELNLADANLG